MIHHALRNPLSGVMAWPPGEEGGATQDQSRVKVSPRSMNLWNFILHVNEYGQG